MDNGRWMMDARTSKPYYKLTGELRNDQNTHKNKNKMLLPKHFFTNSSKCSQDPEKQDFLGFRLGGAPHKADLPRRTANSYKTQIYAHTYTDAHKCSIVEVAKLQLQ